MQAPVIFLFRPRRPGEPFEVWHVAPQRGGGARVVVEREDQARTATTIGRPFGASLSRLARLVEDEADRVLPAAQQTVKRLRELAKGLIA